MVVQNFVGYCWEKVCDKCSITNEYWSIKSFSSHFIAGTREEMEKSIMGEVEEERNEAEEEKRVGEEVMEVMEEEEGRKRKNKVQQSLDLLSPPSFSSPLYLFFSPSPPLLLLPSVPLCLAFIYFMEIIFPHTDTTEQNKKKL